MWDSFWIGENQKSRTEYTNHNRRRAKLFSVGGYVRVKLPTYRPKGTPSFGSRVRRRVGPRHLHHNRRKPQGFIQTASSSYSIKSVVASVQQRSWRIIHSYLTVFPSSGKVHQKQISFRRGLPPEEPFLQYGGCCVHERLLAEGRRFWRTTVNDESRTRMEAVCAPLTIAYARSFKYKDTRTLSFWTH